MRTPAGLSRVVAALAIAGAVLAAGCSTTTSTTGEPSPTVESDAALDAPENLADLGNDDDAGAVDPSLIRRVVMIGDSITSGATPALEERFDALGLETVIEAETGKRMAVSTGSNASGASIAEDLQDADPTDPSTEIWVVALGTNDVGQYASPDEVAAAVNEVLRQVPDEAAVVWVDTYFRDRPEQAEEINAIVRDRIERRGNGVVAPWAEWAEGDGIISGDGVHPTEDGLEFFAFVVTDTVRAFLGR